MKLNQEKLDQMVEAEMKATYPPQKLNPQYKKSYEVEQMRYHLRTALTPFAMEMTDEEIEEVAAVRYGGTTEPYEWGKECGFEIGAKFIRDGK